MSRRTGHDETPASWWIGLDRAGFFEAQRRKQADMARTRLARRFDVNAYCDDVDGRETRYREGRRKALEGQ
jgi:hypothetical protein